jgi:two-component system OmpR family sensor kinase
MFSTLRARLIASYAVILVLALLLAGSAAVVLFNRYQALTAYRDMQLVAMTVASRIPLLLTRRVPLTDLTRRLRDEAQTMGGRLLLLDDNGLVIADSAPGGELEGHQLTIAPSDRDLRVSPRPVVHRLRLEQGNELLYVVVPIPPADPLSDSRPLSRFIALARPVREVTGAWLEIGPRLILVGIAVLLVAILLGVALSRSITRPITAMTRAAEAMAQGDYGQAIPVEGDDEVGRLATSFNTMAREVARAHQMERDFVANVSHDLKTPLTSIQGFAQALVDGTVKDAAGQRQAAQVIFEETGRMNRLVCDLLELAKLESGQVTMTREPVDLASVLRECTDGATHRAEQASITLNVRLADRLPPLSGDAARLEQAFNNLLDNALKYTPAGGQVELSAFPNSDGGIEVSVSDTGPGIPAEDLPRIFERFYRADKARAPGGTGLGLAIVKEIVQAHGGTIRAASEPGQGTRFTVTLPRA